MVCYAHKRKLLVLLLPAVSLVGGSAFCTAISDLFTQIVGWVGVAFFGLYLLTILRRLFQDGPLLVIDKNKIEDRRTGWRVPWHAVEAVWTVQVQSRRHLCIKVDDLSKYQIQSVGVGVRIRQQVARLDAAFGIPEMTVSFLELDHECEEVWAYIKRIKPGLVQ